MAVTCAKGTYSSTAKACIDNTSWVCPHGTAYPCLSNAGSFECSTATCIDPSTAQTTTVSTAMLQNNGPTDASGNCLGTIYIFSGRKMTCNKSGVSNRGGRTAARRGRSPLGEDVGSAESMYSGVSSDFRRYTTLARSHTTGLKSYVGYGGERHEPKHEASRAPLQAVAQRREPHGRIHGIHRSHDSLTPPLLPSWQRRM